MANIILFNKPFDVLSQFTDGENRETLADYIKQKGVYPAGRLDRDSEGLLLLTDDGQLQHLISHPRHKLDKTYWVQVEGEINDEACRQLIKGVELKDGPARAKLAEPMKTPEVWERDPPIRERKSIPTSWLKLVIDEGRNRQVRRMTAAVGLPTLRLIRYAIGNWTIAGLNIGEWKTVSPPRTLLDQLSSSKWKRKKTNRQGANSTKFAKKN
jgi:23S rRNA pseudouridine2457 synthase